MTPVAERGQRRPARPGVLEGRLDVLHRRRHLHRTGVMLGLTAARIRGEVRQFGQCQVDLHHAAAGLPVLDVADEVVRQFVAGSGPGTRYAGAAWSPPTVPDLVAVLQHDTLDPPPRTSIRDTRALVRISAPKLRAERAIAADTAPMPPSGIAPAAQLAVTDIADGMVRHHVGGTGFVPGPAQVPITPLTAKGALGLG